MIISPLKVMLCALALVSPKRPEHLVGTVVTRLNVYRDDRTEHCFEETTRVGRTWLDDELLWMREINLEECQ